MFSILAALYFEYMPRKAIPHTSEAILARQAIRHHLERTQTCAYVLAREAGVGQPTLSKFLNGHTKSVTDDIRKVLDYSGITDNPRILESPRSEENASLRDAITRVWDGSREHAAALAELIEAVGPVLSRHIHQTPKRRVS